MCEFTKASSFKPSMQIQVDPSWSYTLKKALADIENRNYFGSLTRNEKYKSLISTQKHILVRLVVAVFRIKAGSKLYAEIASHDNFL